MDQPLLRQLFYIFLSILILNLSSCHDKEKPIKKIALIGRYNDLKEESGSNEWYDTFVEKSLKAFLQELNDQNEKINLELVVFNIHHDPARSDSVYQMIATDPDFIWVLDNSWGHDMAGARETIIKNRIPVLSINAYKGYNDYGPTALFLIDYENDINYISAFAKYILRRDTIDFISEDDVVFHDHFLNSFEKFELSQAALITYTGQQNINPGDSVVLFNELYDHFVKAGNNHDRVVLYNSHFMWGNAIVDFLNKHLKNSKFMSWSIPQSEYIDRLKDGNELILHHKSHYSVSEPVFINYRKLLKKDYDYFRWDGAASLMEDFQNAIGIIKKFIESRENAEEITSENMADYMDVISKKVTIGANDIVRFNEQRKMLHEKTFTVYSENGISYYPYQLDNDFNVVPALNLGIDLQSIYDVDLNSNSFKADFEYWITGDSVYRNADEFVRIKNLQLDESMVELLSERYVNGNFIKRYNVSGKFFNNYVAESYPFDLQELNVNIELLNPTEELRITIDPVTFNEKISELKINGWKSKDYYVTVNNNIYQDHLTDEREYAKNEEIKIHFFSERNFWGSMLQIILPLFFIGTISIGILYVRRLTFSDLGEVIVGLFLSVVAFSISLAQLTPKFDDLTKADKLFLLTFTIVFFVFIYLILLNSTKSDRFVRTVPYVRIILTLIYPAVFLLLFL